MSVWSYRHVSPYLAAKRGGLLSPGELYELAERNVNFMVTKLMDTPYRREVDGLVSQRVEATLLEDALLSHFAGSVLDAVSFAPGPLVDVVGRYVEKFELDALKSLIKVVYAGVGSADALKYIRPFGRFDRGRCVEIVEAAGGLGDLVEFLIDMDYSYVIYRSLARGGEGQVFLLESELTRRYYEKLWGAAKRVRGLDGEVVRGLVGLEVVSVNVKVLLRCFAAGYGEEGVARYLVVVPGLFGEEVVGEAVQSRGVEEMIEVLRARLGRLGYDYEYMLGAVAGEYGGSGSVGRLEYVMDKSLLLSSQLMMKRYTPFFNAASLMAYVNAKWYEFRNLRAVLYGLSGGLSASQIKGMLIIA